MSKADTLLTQAAAFELLSLYGERKNYLSALAQSNFPDVNPMIAGLDRIRMNATRAANAIWRQDPANFPAREVYNALAYPSVDLKTATGEQLDTGADQLIANLSALYQALANEPRAAFLIQQLNTDIPQARQYAQQLKETLSMARNLLPSEPAAPAPQVSPEATPTPHKTAPPMSLAAAKQLQIFLNEAFRDDIVAGRMGPIEEARGFGPETAGRLREWARRQNLPTNNMQALINSALQQSRAA